MDIVSSSIPFTMIEERLAAARISENELGLRQS